MKYSIILSLGLSAAGLTSVANAQYISTVSTPVRYSDLVYYANAQIGGGGGTWDQANALVKQLPPYKGLAAHLAAFNTAQYNFIVTNNILSSWAIAWTGATNNGTGVFNWIDNTGTVDASFWKAGQPQAGSYAATLDGPSYGSHMVSRTRSESCGQALIEYSGDPALSVNLYAGLTIAGTVGSTYTVQYVTDLSQNNNWQTLTNLVLPSSPYLWSDHSVPATERRYYRVVKK